VEAPVRDAIGTALFVGGPWDGTLRPAFAEDPERYRVMDVPGGCPSGLWTAPPEWLSPQCVVEYRREVFHTPQKDFYFWLAPELSPEDLMARLMVAYHQHKECE
jgi:hypothetical protein